VLFDQSVADQGGLDDLISLAQELKLNTTVIGRSAFAAESITDAPQGVLAMADQVETIDLDDLVGLPGVPFIMVLDGVTDPRNLGALLRTCDGAGVDGLVMSRHGSARLTPTAVKAAAGAVEHVKICQVGGVPAAIDQLKRAGIWVVGLDAGGSVELFDLHLADEPVALVLGSEGSGLSRLVRERCDTIMSIPLAGALDSLNVSVAGALACYEVTRRRRQTPTD